MNTATGIRELIQTLDELGVRFLIGGSTASSVRGVPRATQDIDLLVETRPGFGQALSGRLSADWYADAEVLANAFRLGRSANLIYMPTAYKFDLFPAISAFDSSQLRRASLIPMTVDGEAVRCPIASAEDVVLAKLRWMKLGASVSAQQRRDIQGVLAVTADLDWHYVREWAAVLGVKELLAEVTRPGQ